MAVQLVDRLVVQMVELLADLMALHLVGWMVGH